MYNPATFVENRIEVLHAFVQQHPFGTIVTCGPDGLEATHVPMMLHADVGAKGTLRCHLARANGHWKKLLSPDPVLAIFQGVDHYITPSWYPSTQEHGKVVPTWNYVAIHIRGRARPFDDSELMQHLKHLTDFQEQDFEQPWSVADAPADYIGALSKAIVGIEIPIDTIEGKWKASQNRLKQDQRGVVAGLRALDSLASSEMADIVEQRAHLKPED